MKICILKHQFIKISACKLYCITGLRIRQKITECLSKKIKGVNNLLLLLITISEN